MALGLLLISACGGSTSAEPTEQPSASNAATATEPAGNAGSDANENAGETSPEEAIASGGLIANGDVTLDIWKVWSNDYIALNDLPAVLALEQVTGGNTNYNTVSWAEATEKFTLMITSGTYPDIIEVLVGSYPGGGEAGIQDGVYMELSGLIDQHMPNYKAIRESDERIRKATMSDSGNIFAIYMMRSLTDGTLAGEPAWGGLSIRQDWLDKLGLEKPVTIDDWYNVLSKFKTELNVEAPLMVNQYGQMDQNSFLSAYGVKSAMYLDGATVKYGPMQEGYRQYLETMSKWYSEGLIDQNFLSNNAANIPVEYAAMDKTGAGGNLYNAPRK